ncbi:MAG: DEAD/DEAH box helicase [Anaerolineales bacterium]
MSIQSLLTRWRTDPDTAPNILTWHTSPPRPAHLQPIPTDLPAPLTVALRARGITHLYSHQAAAWEHARRGENVILSTGTASGKTLAYTLPVLASLLEHPTGRALYLFPTKALAQDQLSALNEQLTAVRRQPPHAPAPAAAIYDGDTPQTQRPGIRKSASIVLTNPDMLHTGILPHHTNWADFFRNLRFVIIDEAHTYRGVFGAHVANVIRRLKRIAGFYGAYPQFILASATIGNPAHLGETLIEAPITLIEEDGSARGERHFLIYNPPLTDPALGVRKSALRESVRLAQDLLAHQVQGVLFARSRRSVEMALSYLNPAEQDGVRGYRSGYLPAQRRDIERGLRDGSVRLVVATNALELGIDIGGLGAAILIGYPGTVASVRQQAGRAGRGDAPAAAVLVATPDPLDQFLARHPEYVLERSPEQACSTPITCSSCSITCAAPSLSYPSPPANLLAACPPKACRNIWISSSKTTKRTSPTSATSGWPTPTPPRRFPCAPPRLKPSCSTASIPTPALPSSARLIAKAPPGWCTPARCTCTRPSNTSCKTSTCKPSPPPSSRLRWTTTPNPCAKPACRCSR